MTDKRTPDQPAAYYDYDDDMSDLDLTCPECGGDGMEDDVMPCLYCDGQGYQWCLV